MSEPEGIPAVDHRDGVLREVPAGEPARYWAAYLRSLVTEDGCAINSRIVTESVWPHWRHATGCIAGMQRMLCIRFFHSFSVVAAHWRQV